MRAPWRGLGVAWRLHEAGLAGGDEERVLLNALPEAEAAQAAYRSWGYRKVGEARPGRARLAMMCWCSSSSEYSVHRSG